MRSLVRALFKYHRVETTVPKAKEMQKLASKLITHAKKATLSDIRAIDKVLQDRMLTSKLMRNIAPLFRERDSGYTRVIRTSFRKGDGSAMAILELTELPVKEDKPKKEKKKKPEEVPTAKPEISKEREEKKQPLPEEKPAPPTPLRKKKAKRAPAKPRPTPEKPREKPKGKETPPEKKGLLGKFKSFFKPKRKD